MKHTLCGVNTWQAMWTFLHFAITHKILYEMSFSCRVARQYVSEQRKGNIFWFLLEDPNNVKRKMKHLLLISSDIWQIHDILQNKQTAVIQGVGI